MMLVVAPAGAGKTTALQDVRDRTGAPLVNVNLELSRRMLDLTERQRALQLPHLLRVLVGNGEDTPASLKTKGVAIRSGDVDNDGYGDIIIGASLYPGGGLKGDSRVPKW